MKAFRGEILSVPADPASAGHEAIRHYPDGLLVVEDGLVIACGAYADLADTYAEADTETLTGLIVPGFVDAHVHYPQIGSIASHGEQLMQWLERHIFPAEKAFADRAHADATAAFFLDQLLRHGTTSALVFATVHPGSVDALFEAALQRDMRIVSGKVLMDLGPEDLRDTLVSGRADTEALIARWRGRGRLGYAVTPRFAPDAVPADAYPVLVKAAAKVRAALGDDDAQARAIAHVLSAVVGDNASAKLVEALAALGEARTAIVGAHNELNDVKLRIGVRTKMTGWEDKPPQFAQENEDLRQVS